MSIARGLYKHSKSGKIYMVDSVGKHTETLEDMVCYHAMYIDPEFGARANWIRPAKMFLEEVEINGKKVPRFEKISQNESVKVLKDELLKLMSNSDDQ